MPAAAFRLYFGDRPATAEELGRVEEIVVDQEMDMAWEARVRLSMCVDDKGKWVHGPDEFAGPFTRVRVELRIGDGPFVALIDGPVAGCDTGLDSLPGRSTATLVVRDDSVLLNREEATEVFEGKTDDAVAREVFGRFPQIDSKKVEAPPGAAPLVAVRRGTEIKFLRDLARANGFHAYVLPGEKPGKSVGCFLPDPADPADLPPLILIGAGRNLLDLVLTEDSEGPERTQSRTLTITDQQVTAAQTKTSDLTLTRQLPAIADDNAAIRQLPPEENDREDTSGRVAAQARRSSYAFKVTARVVPGCYAAALSPYRKVTLKAGDLPRVSGDYLLTKVKHRITPSVYSQEFEGKSDSRSDPGASSPSLNPSIF